jgi:hypothetical protein
LLLSGFSLLLLPKLLGRFLVPGLVLPAFVLDYAVIFLHEVTNRYPSRMFRQNHKHYGALLLRRARSTSEKRPMPKVFIEAWPKNRPGHDPVTDYVVEDDDGREIYSSKTQSGAVAWAKAQGHHPFVARIRHRDNDRKIPDHWHSSQ